MVATSVVATLVWLASSLAVAQEVVTDAGVPPGGWGTLGVGGPVVAVAWALVQFKDSWDKKFEANTKTTTEAIEKAAATTNGKIDKLSSAIERHMDSRP